MGYFFILLLICFFGFLLSLCLWKSHLFIYNYFLKFGYNEYALDYVTTVVTNIFIINLQIALVLLGLRLYGLKTSEIGWKLPASFKKIIAGICLAVAFKFAREVFIAGGVTGVSVGMNVFWSKLHNSLAYYFLFVVPFVSPVFEELFYRGFVYTVMRKKLGRKVSVIITACLFTVLHTNKLEFSFNTELFIDGIVYGLLREWDGSVWSSVAAHSTHNLLLSWFNIKG